MDANIEELRRQLREQRERAEEAGRDRERERQRAEFERRRAEEAENQSRLTTLVEYIRESHRHLDLNVTTETDKSLTSQGTITNPQSKYVPSRLSAWPYFLTTQKNILGKLHSTFPAQERAFESVGFLRGLGERVAGRRVANEKDLEHIQQNIVEEPVSKIINVLRSHEMTRNSFDLGGGVVFDNHPNGLSDGAEEPSQRRRARNEGSQTHADQVCVYKNGANLARRTLAFVVEHKPPHKLTMPHLRLGLRPMDIRAEVVNRATIPTSHDPEALFQYHADKIVSAAVSQTYHYMITDGLEYSYLSTGEGYVFFKIDWARPHELLFHLAEPRAEVEAHPENSIHCTAISQVLAFTLLALRSRPCGQDERHLAMRHLHTWAEDYEEILRHMPATERKQTPPASAFEPRTYREDDRSPIILRLRDPTPSCRPPSRDPTNDETDQSDDGSQGLPYSSPSLRTSHRPQQEAQQDVDDDRQATIGSFQSRQYCTQRCLLGLVNGQPLDQACPNVLLHQGGDAERVNHSLDHAGWLHLLQKQLAQTLDAHIVRLGKQGAKGAALQVTLAAYGYTVVAKCTVPEFVEDLHHEESVYKRLKPLQGIFVPVFLGAVRLETPYEYDHRVRLGYMLLLSWAGGPVGAVKRAHLRSLTNTLGAIRQRGVTHGDIREPNMLWCSETNGPMLIDFERATLESLRRPTNARPPKRISGRSKKHRRSESASEIHRLQPLVLNGRVNQPRSKLSDQSSVDVQTDPDSSQQGEWFLRR